MVIAVLVSKTKCQIFLKNLYFKYCRKQNLSKINKFYVLFTKQKEIMGYSDVDTNIICGTKKLF